MRSDASFELRDEHPAYAHARMHVALLRLTQLSPRAQIHAATAMSAINTNGCSQPFQYSPSTFPEALLARRGYGPSESHSDNGAHRMQSAPGYASGPGPQAGSQAVSAVDYEQTRFQQNLSRIMVEAAGSPMAVSGRGLPGWRPPRFLAWAKAEHHCHSLALRSCRDRGSSAPHRSTTCAQTRPRCAQTMACTRRSWPANPRKRLG